MTVTASSLRAVVVLNTKKDSIFVVDVFDIVVFCLNKDLICSSWLLRADY